jgi:hypothetical protein
MLRTLTNGKSVCNSKISANRVFHYNGQVVLRWQEISHPSKGGQVENRMLQENHRFYPAMDINQTLECRQKQPIGIDGDFFTFFFSERFFCIEIYKLILLQVN